MEDLAVGLIVFGTVLLLCPVPFFRRNNAVLDYRLALIDRKYLAATHRISVGDFSTKAGRDEVQRYLDALNQAYESVSYWDQLFRFWKRLPAFYAGTILESEGLSTAPPGAEKGEEGNGNVS